MSKKLLAVHCQCLQKAVKDLSTEALDGIIDVNRIFLSECNLVEKYSICIKKGESDPDLRFNVDYDDLCAPLPPPEHPTFQEYDDIALKPILCTWKFITVQDIQSMRQHLFDKNEMKLIIEKKLPCDNIILEGKGREIFLNFAWEIFKFMRDENFTGKGISSVLGLFYLTHRFFLSNAWRTGSETYNFFKDGLSLHAFLKPPICDLVFNFFEYNKLLDMFWFLYIQKLELIRSVCIPKFNLILNIKKCGMQNYEKLLTTEISEIQL